MQTETVSDPFLTSARKQMIQAAQRYGHSLEWIEGAADWIINQTQVTLSEKERIQFTIQLSQYSKQKLLLVTEYHGNFSGILRYLDELKAPPESAREALGYGSHTVESLKQLADYQKKIGSTIGADACAHVIRVSNNYKPLAERREAERAGLIELHNKYPRAGFYDALQSREKDWKRSTVNG
jgi:hypothetical protein